MFTLVAVLLSMAASGPDGWDILKSLRGDWEGKSDRSAEVVRISYKVVSENSALLETMIAPHGGQDMITVYHRDGDNLMLTHYCGIGNQPRMRAAVAPAEGKRFEFRFLDATNMKAPDAPHMRHLTLTVLDKDHITEEWTNRADGKEQTIVFRLSRK